MKSIWYIQQLTMVFVLFLGLGTQVQAWELNGDIRKLDNHNGKCPCFDRKDLDDLVARADSEVQCTYTYNVDRRLKLFFGTAPDNQAFTRAGVACFGPKVRPGGPGTGLPGRGSYAMYDSEGKHCRKLIRKVANYNGIKCQCINEAGETLPNCPDSL